MFFRVNLITFMSKLNFSSPPHRRHRLSQQIQSGDIECVCHRLSHIRDNRTSVYMEISLEKAENLLKKMKLLFSMRIKNSISQFFFYNFLLITVLCLFIQ